MSWVDYDEDKPDGSSGVSVPNDARYNDYALLCESIMSGEVPKGWTLEPEVGTGTDAEPQRIIASKGAIRLRAGLTWGTSGYSKGSITTAVWKYSEDSGSTYPTTIKTVSVTYGAGYPTVVST